jgi:uncharacterized protein
MTSNIKHLEVVLKTVERCNLNCSYCYFFNGGDLSYKKHPPFISRNTVSQVASFLEKGCRTMRLDKIKINFHGGEPTLQKTAAFDEMCSLFRNTLDPLTDLDLTMQTNGTLITDEWIELFSKHQIKVGVSCDGPPEWHDQVRIDHKGNGSHEKMNVGIQKLVKALQQKRIPQVGILCVINLSTDPRRLYNHFTKELGIKWLDFLLPKLHHDNFHEKATDYGAYLCDLFNVWTEEDDPDIQIRILEKALGQLVLDQHGLKKLDELSNCYREITIASDGSLGTVDVIRLVSQQLFTNEQRVDTITLEDYLNTALMNDLATSLAILPDACRGCRWQDSCQGGYMTSRYSHQNKFNNPSIYCEGLKLCYSNISNFLLSNGYPTNQTSKTYENFD